MYRFSPSSFQNLLILGHQQGLEISLRGNRFTTLSLRGQKMSARNASLLSRTNLPGFK